MYRPWKALWQVESVVAVIGTITVGKFPSHPQTRGGATRTSGRPTLDVDCGRLTLLGTNPFVPDSHSGTICAATKDTPLSGNPRPRRPVRSNKIRLILSVQCAVSQPSVFCTPNRQG